MTRLLELLYMPKLEMSILDQIELMCYFTIPMVLILIALHYFARKHLWR